MSCCRCSAAAAANGGVAAADVCHTTPRCCQVRNIIEANGLRRRFKVPNPTTTTSVSCLSGPLQTVGLVPARVQKLKTIEQFYIDIKY